MSPSTVVFIVGISGVNELRERGSVISKMWGRDPDGRLMDQTIIPYKGRDLICWEMCVGCELDGRGWCGEIGSGLCAGRVCFIGTLS